MTAQTNRSERTVRGEAAGVDEDQACDPLRALERQPAGRVTTDRIADDNDVAQIQQVCEFHQQIAELGRAQRDGRQGRVAMTWPVQGQRSAAVRQRVKHGREIGAVVQRGVQQQDRWARALVGVGNGPK